MSFIVCDVTDVVWIWHAAVPSARTLSRSAVPPRPQAAPADLRPRLGLADRVSAAPDPRAGPGERLGPDHIWVSRIVRQVISPRALVPDPRLVDADALHCHLLGQLPRPGPLTRSPSRLRLLFFQDGMQQASLGRHPKV